MTGEATPGAARRLPRGAAGQGRDGRGDRAASPTSMLEHASRIEVAGRDASTSSAPAATARTRSTSRRWRRSSSPATGVPVVKHGNRAASSASGSADVLEALGRPPRPARRRGSPRSRTEAGIAFCFAPVFHPALAARRRSPRRELGVADRLQLPRPADQPGAAAVRGGRRRRRADGADHGRGASPSRGATRARLPRRRRARRADHRPRRRTVWWVRDGAVTEQTARPADVGLAAADPVEPARRRRRAQRRRRRATCSAGEPGPVRDAVLLNARHRARDGGRAERRRPCRRRARSRAAVRRRAWTRAPRPPSTPGRAGAAGRRWVETTAGVRGLTARVGRVSQPSRPRLNAASRSCEE